ncbi:MAG: phosphoribosyltransferase family protein [Candidatus Delongbacteria bacterium]|jgi:ComF family protein|nr:phosphoribosyltransferase family protein [Candidatus Delongbacteria bacterium]
MKNKLFTYWQDFWYLFYPKICDACGKSLMHQEAILCTECLVKLPRTSFHDDTDNELAQVFWGRVNIEQATALMHFVKGSLYRKLIHKLKYQNRPDIGEFLGRELGGELKQAKLFQNLDCIIPVPLHPDKQKIRGYNQAEMIAKGMSSVMDVPVSSNNLVRKVFTKTQTKKGRYDRWENVSRVFEVHKPDEFANKYVLLVDDVITTGATIEACVQNLLSIEGTTVSLGCIGMAGS